jgi:uncharacterized protein YdhG (YjbR/CyaY superfamily)
MQSKAKTVEDYLAQLPPERREVLSAVRKVILKNLPKGFEEVMQYGMISYVVPLKLYPAGYHCDSSQPLCFAGLASQKNHMAIYLMTVYGHNETQKWFIKAYKASGKKLDMGKSCVRFKRLEDLPLDVIGQAIARVPLLEYLRAYEGSRREK